jgi:demethylmenaquinone methyltransferase/2-methoxy-6-polyprenyl-1,4-benzoquinol methylase
LTLRSTLSTAEGKRRYVRWLFATIADRYDFITGFLSYGQDRRWKQRLIDLAAPQPSDRALDVACGTGDLLFAVGERARTTVGLDVTHRMLQLARSRRGRHQNVSLVTGDMMALPFPDARFELVTIGYGLRNVPDLPAALTEIHRVLAPGGRLLSLDFNKPTNAIVRAAYLAYLTVVGGLLGIALHRDPNTYRYIPESLRLYPDAAAIGRMMSGTGFTTVEVIPLLGGLMAIHVGVKRSR